MHRSRWMIRQLGRWRTFSGFVAVTVAASLAASAPARAVPEPAQAPTIDLSELSQGPRDKDNRIGRIEPTDRQLAQARQYGSVRFNALGTPAALGPGQASAGQAAAGAASADQAVAGHALATGLAADPETAARQYLINNQDLFGLDEAAVAAMDRLLVQPMGTGAVVLLAQRFGDLPAGHDGLVAILVSNGNVLRVTSSLSRDTREPEPATLTPQAAIEFALRDAGLTEAQVDQVDVREVAVPTPTEGPRAAYAITFFAHDVAIPTGYTTYVDARTGAILVREDLVDFATDNPIWSVFEATPPAKIKPGEDPRVLWCLNPAPNCERTVHDPASGEAWDIDLRTGEPTFTSSGNSANNVVSWGGGTPRVPATPSPDRTYTYSFTDQWHEAKCDPAVFTSAQRNDADAAVTNLFAMHNRMHDWAFHLGFTEATWNLQVVNLTPNGLGNDPEMGRAQSGAISGSRNNANQGTPRDGLAPTTNMFLWQPIAGSAYPPCVDGDYDMTVIAHEYTHAITNRMIAGPNTGIGSFQGGAMGEAWGDLMAAEYLFEYGLRAPGKTPFITGGYVTGNLENGIRNYDASKSPLNYSNVGFDLVGPEVHADGEIWVATNLRVREAFIKRYGHGTPKLQRSCADGLTPVTSCPGNRRWVQLVFDSFLLQASSQFSMLDMRDNMLAADLARFGGANQDLIWNAFAESGMGEGAASTPSDTDPTPSFASPYADNATVTLRPAGDAAGAVVRLYVGDWEARSVPIADTDPATPIPDVFQIVPKVSFHFTAVGAGFGHHKFSKSFQPGRDVELRVDLRRNLASTALGATFSGDGINLDKLGDDTEATNWASRDGVAGKQVTIDLAGDLPHQINTVNVSAMLRPAITGDPDPGTQNRFSALRSFRLWACDATVSDCTSDSGYRVIFTSRPDAFPAGAFRPFAPQINLRTFRFKPVSATHLRIEVLTSQCTGNPLYAGEQDNDPRAATDCATASPAANHVRVAEVQVFAE